MEEKDYQIIKGIIDKYCLNYERLAHRFRQREEVKYFQKFFFELLNRMRINTESLLPLFDLLKESSQFKLPLSLILRSISADTLTLLYLLSFYDESDDNQSSIINEAKILDREFLLNKVDLLKEEKEFKKDLSDEFPFSDGDFLKYDNEIEKSLKENSDLIERNANGKIIAVKADKIRITSNKKLFLNNGDFNKPDRNVTEAYKYGRLGNVSNFHRNRHIYYCYKYYTQFYHYSPSNYELIDWDTKIDKEKIIYTFYFLILASRTASQVLLNKKDTVYKLYNELFEELGKLISDKDN